MPLRGFLLPRPSTQEMRGDITSKIRIIHKVEMAIATFAPMPNRYEYMQDQDGKEEKAYTAVKRKITGSS